MKRIEKEIETRSYLSEEKYLEIVSDLLFNHEKMQTINMVNQYFDTDELSLKDQHITLRVRQTYHNSTLTLKCSSSKEEAIEISQHLSNHQHIALVKHNHFPTGPVKLKLRSLGMVLSDIHYNSENKVRRFEIKKEDYILCLDKCVIRDTTTFNIEVEANTLEKANKVITDLAKKYKFEISKEYESKSKRTLIKK